MSKGDRVFVRDYNQNGDCVFRPAEVAAFQGRDPEIVNVIFLDVKFRKGGRACWSEPVLRSKIVPEERSANAT